MKRGFFDQHWTDEKGNPAGGVSSGCGFTISWQNGPLGRGNLRQDPNGAFVEDVIAAAIGRIEFYQTGNGTSTSPVAKNGPGKFWCQENEDALTALREAMKHLNNRTARREVRGVEGTHAV